MDFIYKFMFMSQKTDKPPKLIMKAPQTVVHIKHTISLRQYKLWLILLQKFRDIYLLGDEIDEKGFFVISKKDIQKYIGYEPVKEELKSDFEKLRREPIIINYLEKDGTPTMHGMGFISEWKISSKTVRFRIPSFLEDVMKGLDQPQAIFQLINWDIFNQFSGKYEAIIYKLCRDYIGIKRTPYMSIKEFREYIGIKESEYKEFRRLNELIISTPCKKINESEFSDVLIFPEFKREGRKILGIYFKVEPKYQTSIPFIEFESSPAFRFSKITIESTLKTEYLALRAPEEISLCIERANEYAESQEKQNRTVNYGAIYRKAISEGWHTNFAEKKAQKEELASKAAEEEKIKQQEAAIEKDEKEKEALYKKVIKEKTTKGLAVFETFSEQQKQILRQEFAQTLPDMTRKIFETRGEKTPMHRYSFVLFLEEKGLNIGS